MIERLGRLLAVREAGGDGYAPTLPYHLELARFVVERMRKPTEAMMEAGADIDRKDPRNFGQDLQDFWPQCAEACWEKMIDEALR